MPYLEVENIYKIWKSANSTLSVDLSFSADLGSFTSIVGPSGSGKSTVLRIIAGLLKNDKPHKIILNNKDITSLEPNKRECGMVFQNSALFLHLTAKENVAYGLRCKGFSKKEAFSLAEDFLKKLKLENCIDRYPETLSGGEAQRVSLARTLIVKPKLVLLDEPMSALDAPLRKELGNFIRETQKSLNFTAIMVTHDINEAKNISDKILMLKSGKLCWQGNALDFSESFLVE